MFDPSSNWLLGLLSDFKFHWPMCLSLHDHGSRKYASTLYNVENAQINQFAATTLAINGQIKQGQIAGPLHKLQFDANCPDFLEL